MGLLGFHGFLRCFLVNHPRACSNRASSTGDGIDGTQALCGDPLPLATLPKPALAVDVASCSRCTFAAVQTPAAFSGTLRDTRPVGSQPPWKPLRRGIGYGGQRFRSSWSMPADYGKPQLVGTTVLNRHPSSCCRLG